MRELLAGGRGFDQSEARTRSWGWTKCHNSNNGNDNDSDSDNHNHNHNKPEATIDSLGRDDKQDSLQQASMIDRARGNASHLEVGLGVLGL